MEVLDNKAHILGVINQQAKRQITQLEKEYKDRLSEEHARIKAELSVRLKELNDKHVKQLERLKKQRESAFELLKAQRMLEVQNGIYARVMERVRNILGKEELQHFIELMVKRLHGRNFKTLKVPKGAKIQDAEAVLDGLNVIGIVSANEEVEISIDDLLREHHAKIHTIVAKELYQ